ncbi:MAG: hypothetical protein ACTSQJ_14300 [Promethearchaeota archaeon]
MTDREPFGEIGDKSSGANIFTDTDFSQSEDIVIIVENSPKFYITDISPSRYLKFIQLMEEFVKERLKIDYRDRCYLIILNDNIFEPFNDFENFSHALIDKINQAFENPRCNINGIWEKSFMSSFQKGIQKCIASFKKIRNKTLRMIIITNELPSVSERFYSQVKQVIERTAQRLDIIIDILFITGSKSIKVLDFENPYKLISDMTGGKYFQIKNSLDFEESFKEIKKKKKILRKIYLGEREYSQEKKFLEIIASDLEKITEFLEDSELKCQICFKKECSCEIIDTYDHLRRCPNCKKILHLCCSGRWAEQQNQKSNFIGYPNVFRCPYCFFLLKVPQEFVNFEVILNQLQEKWLKARAKEEKEKRELEQKEKEIQAFLNEFENKQTERQRIFEWLTEMLPSKSRLDIERIVEDIEILPNRDEKISFIDYLKFKENIDDDSYPI